MGTTSEGPDVSHALKQIEAEIEGLGVTILWLDQAVRRKPGVKDVRTVHHTKDAEENAEEVGKLTKEGFEILAIVAFRGYVNVGLEFVVKDCVKTILVKF